MTFEIKSDAKALKNIQVYSIEVFLSALEESHALVRFLPHTTAGFPEMQSDELKLGATIDINLGYDSKNECIFSGKLDSQELMVTHEDGADITIVCKEEARSASGVSGLELCYGENILEMELVNTNEGVSGIVKTEGVHIQPGQTFALKGASALFDGTHEVKEVIHDVIQGNWWTQLHIGVQVGGGITS